MVGKWKRVKLGEVATIVAGSTPKTSVDEYWNGEYNWITPAELDDTTQVIKKTERKITKKAIKDTCLKPLPVGTVLLSSRAPIGKVAIAGVKMYCNQGFKNLICSDRIHNKYLFWFLKGRAPFLNFLGRGATFKEISKTIVEKIQIPLPPLETQKHIAKTLDTAAELLDLYKEQLAELDNLIKFIFYDMFGDPVVNEKGWDKRRLADECKIITGNTPPRKDRENYGDYIEWIKSDNISVDSIYLDKAKEYLSKKGFSVCRYVNKPSVLMTCIAGSIKCIGNVGIANRKVAFNQQINAIVPKDNNVYFFYFLLLFSQAYIQSTINMSLKGILSKGRLSGLKFIIPPLALQNQFASIVSKIEEQKASVQKAADEAQYLFDCLMSKYFE